MPHCLDNDRFESIRARYLKWGKAVNEKEIARRVVDACFQIHTRLGPGLFETVYETILEYELKKARLTVARQVEIPIQWDGLKFDRGFRADLIVENRVLIEIKSLEQTIAAHRKQVLTYLKLTDLRLGLLINFGSPLIKNGITRLVNQLDES